MLANLDPILPSIAPVVLNVQCTRAISTKVLTQPGGDILFARGPKLRATRFTPAPPNGFELLYTALDPNTALVESRALILGGGNLEVARPTTIFTIECHLLRVLDLTLAEVQEILETNDKELAGNWMSWNGAHQIAPTQRLGHVVFLSGLFDAIKCPSAEVPGRHCLNILTEMLVPYRASYIEIFDDEGYWKRRRIPA